MQDGQFLDGRNSDIHDKYLHHGWGFLEESLLESLHRDMRSVGTRRKVEGVVDTGV